MNAQPLTESDQEKTLPRGRRVTPFVVAALATGLVTLLAHWALIAAAGSAIPYWDQWDGAGLYLRWVDGTWKISQLAAAHMEHRIVLTNLWNLGWFYLLGGWDPLAQMVVNALVPAVTAALLAGWLLPLRESRWWRLAVMAGVVVIMAGP